MEDMIGDIVYLNPPNSNNLSFKYKEYTWRYEDVEEIDTTPPNYPAPELFDPSNLIGD